MKAPAGSRGLHQLVAIHQNSVCPGQRPADAPPHYFTTPVGGGSPQEKMAGAWRSGRQVLWTGKRCGGLALSYRARLPALGVRWATRNAPDVPRAAPSVRADAGKPRGRCYATTARARLFTVPERVCNT